MAFSSLFSWGSKSPGSLSLLVLAFGAAMGYAIGGLRQLAFFFCVHSFHCTEGMPLLSLATVGAFSPALQRELNLTPGDVRLSAAHLQLLHFETFQSVSCEWLQSSCCNAGFLNFV